MGHHHPWLNMGSPPQGNCQRCLGMVRALQGTVAPKSNVTARSRGLTLAVTWEVGCAFKTCYSQQFFILQKIPVPFAMLTQHELPQFSSSWEDKCHLLASQIYSCC